MAFTVECIRNVGQTTLGAKRIDGLLFIKRKAPDGRLGSAGAKEEGHGYRNRSRHRGNSGKQAQSRFRFVIRISLKGSVLPVAAPNIPKGFENNPETRPWTLKTRSHKALKLHDKPRNSAAEKHKQKTSAARLPSFRGVQRAEEACGNRFAIATSLCYLAVSG